MTVTASAVVGQVDLGDHVCWAYDDETAGLDAVGRVSFADVGAATALLHAVRTEHPGGVRLVGCRPALRRLLDLVGDAGIPGPAESE